MFFTTFLTVLNKTKIKFFKAQKNGLCTHGRTRLGKRRYISLENLYNHLYYNSYFLKSQHYL